MTSNPLFTAESNLNAPSNSLPPGTGIWTSDPQRNEPGWEDLARAADYDLEELAKLLSVSIRTLQRYFAKHQLRASTWIRELRLQESYDRLRKGERVKEVAYDLGYSQLSNFARDFKSRFGVPPSTLRRPQAFPCPSGRAMHPSRQPEVFSSPLAC